MSPFCLLPFHFCLLITKNSTLKTHNSNLTSPIILSKNPLHLIFFTQIGAVALEGAGGGGDAVADRFVHGEAVNKARDHAAHKTVTGPDGALGCNGWRGKAD